MTSDTSRARHPIRTPSACDGGVRWFLLFIAGHGGPCDRPSAVDGAVRAKRPKGRAPPRPVPVTGPSHASRRGTRWPSIIARVIASWVAQFGGLRGGRNAAPGPERGLAQFAAACAPTAAATAPSHHQATHASVVTHGSERVC